MIPIEYQKDAVKQFCAVMHRVFNPPPRLKPSEWAETHRRMSPETSAKKHGRWRNYPMQVEPMDSMVDPDVQSTCLMWAAQTAGKTELICNIVGYIADQDPGPVLMVQPDLILAETWSKDRYEPMVRDTPILRELTDPKYNKRGNTVLHKTFPGGHVTCAGANSAASLAGRPVSKTLFDEVDRYPESAGKEGDPIGLGERRMEAFGPLAWSLKTSTPTIRRHSRIEKEFDISDKRYWFVKCPDCEMHQTLKWAQVRWESEEHLEDTYYLCANRDCSSKWDDAKRIAIVRGGYWRATAPFRGVRGYHLNGIYSLMKPLKGFKTKLHQMAADFLKAKRLGKENLKVWTNTFLAETWEDEQQAKPTWHGIYERREDYLSFGKIPKGVRIITAGLDFQADRVEAEIVGHGIGEETWGLRHERLYGDPRKPEIYSRIDALLNMQFEREDRAQLKVVAAGFDTGFYQSQRMLYAYLRPRLGRGFYAFKGANRKNAEPISHSAKSKVETVKLILVGTNRIKTYIYGRLTHKMHGPGYIHVPQSYTIEWCKQFVAEEFRTITEAGQSFWEFYMPEATLEEGTDRNEALDMRVYAMAALYARGVPNWDFLEKLNLRTIPADGESAPLELGQQPFNAGVVASPVILPEGLPMYQGGNDLNTIRRVKRKRASGGLLRGILS